MNAAQMFAYIYMLLLRPTRIQEINNSLKGKIKGCRLCGSLFCLYKMTHGDGDAGQFLALWGQGYRITFW